jgi:acyl-CoA dehydrogenase
MILTDEQRLIRDTARSFAAERLAPFAAEWDRESRFPAEAIAEMGRLGLMGMLVPPEEGGAGADHVSYALALEEIAAGDGATSTIMSVHNSVGCMPILRFGSAEQRRRFLEPMARGELLAAFCLTEPEAGSDVANMSTTAVRDGDHYVLNGSKCFITNGGQADQYTVFATVDKAKKHKGITCFVVEGRPKGLTPGKHENKMGQRASDTVTLTFEDVRVPVANRIGEEGEGFRIAMETLDNSRPITAIMSVGIARAALEYSLEYSSQRRTFGKPIREHQAIQFMLADMAMNTHAARLLCHESAWLLDQGQKNTLLSSYAKCFAADMAMKVATDAVQVYGGYGYIKEYPVEKLMRDAKLIQIYEGTSQVQRLVIAKELFK